MFVTNNYVVVTNNYCVSQIIQDEISLVGEEKMIFVNGKYVCWIFWQNLLLSDQLNLLEVILLFSCHKYLFLSQIIRGWEEVGSQKYIQKHKIQYLILPKLLDRSKSINVDLRTVLFWNHWFSVLKNQDREPPFNANLSYLLQVTNQQKLEDFR